MIINLQEISKWIYIINRNAFNMDISGKYMFFSDNKEELIELGKKLLIEYDLFAAKIPNTDIPNKNPGFGFVLCVYAKDDTLYSMKHYSTETISYRGFKSNYKTQQGIYSQEFLTNKTH